MHLRNVLPSLSRNRYRIGQEGQKGLDPRISELRVGRVVDFSGDPELRGSPEVRQTPPEVPRLIGAPVPDIQLRCRHSKSLSPHVVDRKGTTKKLCDKDVAKRSGEYSGAIGLKALFYWVMTR